MTIKTWTSRFDALPLNKQCQNMADQFKDAEIAELREALAAAQTTEAWRPIETAPKDFVTVFDGWNGDRVADVCWGHPEYSPKGHRGWCVSAYEHGHGWVLDEVKNLTHWMPLPDAPAPPKQITDPQAIRECFEEDDQ